MTNRLHALPALEPDSHSASIHSTASAVCTHGGAVCRHALFAPLHYERNYGYPLVVWLHSPGDDERQLRRVMPHLSMRNYVAIAPRGTSAADADRDARSDADVESAAEAAFDGESDDDECGYGWAQRDDDILLAAKRVFDCIDLAAARLHVKRERVFIAGAGCGGTMALRIALANPKRFAGAVSLGGGLPRGCSPLGRLNEARRLPLLLMAGLASQRYPQTRVNDDLRLLHSAGIAVTLRLYPFGDEIAPMMLGDVDRWLMEQICPESANQSADAE